MSSDSVNEIALAPSGRGEASPVLPRAYWAALAYHHTSCFGRFPETTRGQESPSILPDGGGVSLEASGRIVPLAALLRARLSDREFGSRAIGADDLLQLLWAACGFIDGVRRTVPSAGGLYALQAMVAVRHVQGLDPGAYAFNARTADLVRLDNVSLPASIGSMFSTKHVDYARASAVVFFVADLHIICGQYGERGYRYALLEAGHCAQNLSLAAALLETPCVPLGGFEDEMVNASFGLRPEVQVALYAVALGRRR